MSVPANPHMGTSPRDTWALSLGTANVTLLTPQPSLEIVYKYVDWMGKLPRADLPCLNQDGIWIWLPASWYNLSWREPEQRDISMMMGTLYSLFKKKKRLHHTYLSINKHWSWPLCDIGKTRKSWQPNKIHNFQHVGVNIICPCQCRHFDLTDLCQRNG